MADDAHVEGEMLSFWAMVLCQVALWLPLEAWHH